MLLRPNAHGAKAQCQRLGGRGEGKAQIATYVRAQWELAWALQQAVLSAWLATGVEGGRQLCAPVQALMPAIALASGDVALQAAGAREGMLGCSLRLWQRARAVEGPPAVACQQGRGEGRENTMQAVLSAWLAPCAWMGGGSCARL